MPEHDLILQEYLLIDHDTRIIVLDYKALGAIKRLSPTTAFRSNRSIGSTSTQIYLNKLLIRLTVQ